MKNNSERLLNPRKTLERFVSMMEEKLRRNSFKSDWRNCSDDHLRRRLRDNYEAMYESMTRGGSPEVVISKATNVANFAMMIALNAERRNKKKKKKTTDSQIDANKGNGPGCRGSGNMCTNNAIPGNNGFCYRHGN